MNQYEYFTGEEGNHSNSCMNDYVPRFESVGDVCSPASTFKDEYNTQGLNSPMGFNSTVVGSPL